jgi:ATP-dependent RNA helicase DHX36
MRSSEKEGLVGCRRVFVTICIQGRCVLTFRRSEETDFFFYQRARESTFPGYPVPEILRIRLENLILSLKILCVRNLKDFLSQMIDPPDEVIIDKSIELLQRLNALDRDERLTPLGLHLARLPMDPQAGKMVLFGAIFSCFDPISSVAASLSFKNAFYAPIGKEREVDEIRVRFAKNTQSDHLMLANIIEDWRTAKRRNGNDYAFCRENFLSFTVLNQLEKMKQQFCELLHSSK